MKQHEREFFIASIRTGKVFLDNNITIHSPTVEQNLRSINIYKDAFQEAYDDEVMTEEEMLDWMIEHDLWSSEKEERIKGLEKDIERLKVEIYKAKNDENLVKQIRLYLRAGEKQLVNENKIKNQYYQNTCEGLANTEKFSWIIENTTFKGDELYDFSGMELQQVIGLWQLSILKDSCCRELARNEPWRTLWSVREHTKLYLNKDDQELTHNQKNLLIWSKMYDNIQESIDCPSKEVIDDDDMLDGWFIIQAEKREKERATSDFESNTNDRISQSDEVFVVSGTEKDRRRTEGMNSAHAKTIKKQRAAVIREKGTAQQHDFADEKLRIQNQQAEAWKNKRGG
tara:strand:- start:176 stop:1201 length:1026 start_codon:yes stop_codon:yes gene_type:complete